MKLCVEQVLERMMPRLIRKGTPLTPMQMEEPLGRWRKIEAVGRPRL